MKELKKFLLENTTNKQTVIKNTFWLTFSEVIGRLLKMVLIIYIARNLGALGWGIFSYTLSIGSLLMIFSDIGISNLITREIVQRKKGHEQLISTALFLKALILVASTILVILISPLVSNIPEADKLFIIIATILFFDSLTNISLAINRALEKMEREVVIKIVTNITTLVLGIILLRINAIPKSIAVAYVVGSAMSFILIFNMIKKDIKDFIVGIDRKKISLVLQTTWPFAIILLAGTIMANTDIFMLGIWKTPEDIGLYAAAQRFFQFMIIIPSVVGTATFPIMSRLARNTDHEQSASALEKTLAFMMMLSIPISLGGFVLANQIMPVVFGVQYMDAIPILQIFMLLLLVSFPVILLSNVIFSHNQQKNLTTTYALGIIINVFINLLLIPTLGAKGAAIATFISSTIITVAMWMKVKNITNFKILPKLTRMLLVALMMLFVTLVLKYLGINVILNIMISSLVYFIFLLILNEPTLQEIREEINI